MRFRDGRDREALEMMGNVARELLGGGVPGFRILLQRLQHDVVDVATKARR